MAERICVGGGAGTEFAFVVNSIHSYYYFALILFQFCRTVAKPQFIVDGHAKMRTERYKERAHTAAHSLPCKGLPIPGTM